MKNRLIATFVCIFFIIATVSVVQAFDRNIPISDSFNNKYYLTGKTNFFINNGDWSEKAKLKASDAARVTFFGWSLSLDRNYAIIGTHSDENASFTGAGYIFKREGSTWTEKQRLTPSDAAPEDFFGWRVSMDGDYAIIGAFYSEGSGAAYIFKNSGTSWVEQAKLIPSDAELWDEFGFSVDIDGDYAIVGSQADDDFGSCTGSAYIFKREGETWTEQAKLTASDAEAEAWFGMSVAIYGEYAIIGSWDNNYTGSAYIFKREGTTWTQQAKLTASDGIPGDRLGISVAIEGEYAAVGSINDNNWYGAAYIYKQEGTTWTEFQKLTSSDGDPGDCFGINIDIENDCLIVGAYDDNDNGIHSGSAYVFYLENSTWTEKQKLFASDAAVKDQFGCCISIDGNYVLIGAYSEDDFTGSAYVFNKPGSDLSFKINGGLGANVKITNDGTLDAEEVTWEINVKGGIRNQIDKTKNGVIDVKAGSSKRVSTGLFFGLGAIDITATIDGEIITAQGKQLIILTLIK